MKITNNNHFTLTPQETFLILAEMQFNDIDEVYAGEEGRDENDDVIVAFYYTAQEDGANFEEFAFNLNRTTGEIE